MHPNPSLFPKRLQLRRKPPALRLAFYYETPVPSPRTVVREPQECERSEPPLTSSVVIERRQSAEFDQTGLLLVKRQLKFRHPLLESSQHPSRIICVLKAHHEIIGISDDDHSTTRHPIPPLTNPQVQHIMQKDVG